MNFKLIYIALVSFFLFSIKTEAQTTPKLHYTVFTTLSKKGCYTALEHKTFMMPNSIDYDLKMKIVNKKKDALKTDLIRVNSKSFTLAPLDWVVVVEINYGKIACGEYKSIKSFSVTNESEIQSKIDYYIETSAVSDPHIGYKILLKEQPNKPEKTAMSNKILQQSLEFLDSEEKKEIKQKSTAIGVRG